MTTATERLALLITADGKGAIRELEKVGKTADQQLGRASSKADQWAARMTTLGIGLTAVAATGAVGLYKLAGAASNLEQAVGGTEAVFGDASGAIDSFAATSADAFGLSQRAAREATSRIGALLKGMGFAADDAAQKAVNLTQLGADLAATFGGPVDDAVTAVAAALRGERDPIERYGIALKQADVDARVLSLGLDTTTTAAKKQAQGVATLALIMEQAGGAQGQFGRESDTLAGQQARLKAQFEDLQATIGKGVMPLFSALVDGASDLVKVFTSLPQPMQQTIGKVLGVTTAIAGVSGVMLLAAGQMIKMRDTFQQLPAGIQNVTGKLGGLNTALIGIAGALVVVEGFKALDRVLEDSAPPVDRLTVALENFQRTGQVGGALAQEYGEDLKKLADEITRASRASSSGLDDQFAQDAKSGIEAVDQALAALAKTDLSAASAAFRGVARALEEQGIPVEVTKRAFDDYAAAVEDAGLANAGLAPAVRATVLPFNEQVDAIFRSIDAQLAAQSANESLQGLLRDLTGTTTASAGATQTAAAAAIEAAQKQLAYRDALVGVADAAHAVQDAERALVDASKSRAEALIGVADAQKELDLLLKGAGPAATNTKEAAEDLDDKRRAEQAAVLDVADAEAALKKARRTGTGTDVERAQLRLAEARDRLESVTADVTEAERIYQGFLKGFPKTSGEVRQAEENLTTARGNLEDATRRDEDAHRALAAAQRGQADASLALRRADADLKGQLDSTRGSIRKTEKAAADAEKKILAWAEAQADLTGKTKGSEEWTRAFLESLVKLRGFIAPGSELAQFLERLIGQFVRLYSADVEAGKRRIAERKLIEGRAHGGPVSAGSPYVVGERGPELFVPRTSGSIVPNGRGGTATINVSIYMPPGSDGDDVVEKIERWRRRNAPRAWMN